MLTTKSLLIEVTRRNNKVHHMLVSVTQHTEANHTWRKAKVEWQYRAQFNTTDMVRLCETI